MCVQFNFNTSAEITNVHFLDLAKIVAHRQTDLFIVIETRQDKNKPHVNKQKLGQN